MLEEEDLKMTLTVKEQGFLRSGFD